MPKTSETFAPCYCSNLRKAARLTSKLYDEELKPGGLKVTQYSLLSQLQRLGPLSMAALGQATKLERTTLLRNLNLLVQKALVRIEPVADSRAYAVDLTAQGRDALVECRPFWQSAQTKIEGLLSEEERYVLRKILQKLAAQ